MWRHLHSAAPTLQPVKWVTLMISRWKSWPKWCFLLHSSCRSHVTECGFSSKLLVKLEVIFKSSSADHVYMRGFRSLPRSNSKNAAFMGFLGNESDLSKRLIPSAVVFHAYYSPYKLQLNSHSVGHHLYTSQTFYYIIFSLWKSKKQNWSFKLMLSKGWCACEGIKLLTWPQWLT